MTTPEFSQQVIDLVGDPASAAAPRGLSFMRRRASEKRLASRPNIST